MLAAGATEFLKKSDGLESYDRCVTYMQVMLQLNRKEEESLTLFWHLKPQ